MSCLMGAIGCLRARQWMRHARGISQSRAFLFSETDEAPLRLQEEVLVNDNGRELRRGTLKWKTRMTEIGREKATAAFADENLPRLILDMQGFTELHTDDLPEEHIVHSEVTQILETAAANTASPRPLAITVCGVRKDSDLGRKILERMEETGLLDRLDIRVDERALKQLVAEQRDRHVVLVSPDAREPLKRVEDKATYIIRMGKENHPSRLRTSFKKARQLRIVERRMPISEVFHGTARVKHNFGKTRSARYPLSTISTFRCIQEAYVLRSWRPSIIRSLPARLLKRLNLIKHLSPTEKEQIGTGGSAISYLLDDRLKNGGS